MPAHNSSRSGMKGPASVGAGARSAVTGHKLGKAAARAMDKCAGAVDDVLEIVGNATSAADLVASLAREFLTLARVLKSHGGARWTVRLLDGVEMDLSIAGSVAFRGRAATKTDRINCICVGDVAIVRGGRLTGKLSRAASKAVERSLKELSVSYPRWFFAEADAEECEADDLFDRSEEEAAERAEAEARLEEAWMVAQEKARLRKKACVTKGLVEDASVPVVGEADAPIVEREVAVDLETSDEEASAASGGGGPNRAERRAALRAEREAAARAEEIARSRAAFRASLAEAELAETAGRRAAQIRKAAVVEDWEAFVDSI